MHNPPFLRFKEDRRDPVSRASKSQCPSCGAVEPAVVSRTDAAVYFGCNLCSHLWHLPKRGQEPIAQLEIEFRQTD